MVRQAIVWRESVYKNGFRCHCGAELADADGQPIEDNLLIKNHASMVYVYCKKCKKPMAYLRYVDLPEDAGYMHGNIEDYERERMN